METVQDFVENPVQVIGGLKWFEAVILALILIAGLVAAFRIFWPETLQKIINIMMVV